MHGRKKSRKEAWSHIRNLFALAHSDGHYAEIEKHLLISVASRLGIDESELEDILADTENVEFHLPKHYDDRVEQFQDLLMLIAIDGSIDEREMEFARRTAEKYELTEREFRSMVKQFT